MSHGTRRLPTPVGLSDLRSTDEAALPPPTVDAGAGRGVPAWLAATLNHCSRCGAALRLGMVSGEDRERLACDACGFVAYVNPRLVVTCLPVTEAGEVMLLRRGIEPGRGLWAQPGGFMEIDETVEAGAVRETLEETGLLVEPDEPNGAAVVMIHGGPTWHHSNEWDALRQAFVAAGVTVIHPNYRGSDGYGRTWQLANRFLMGQGEALDCAASHAYLVALGCDPARIAVTGRSWGGFLTMAMVTQFPELWAAGVAGVPFFDFIDSATDPAIREDLRWWDRENTGDPVRDRSKLEYYSPINHLDRIRAPLLLLAGELDPRCPPRQSREVAQMLAERGKSCEVVVYPDEGHEISGLEHRVDYDVRTLEFILEHVGVATA